MINRARQIQYLAFVSGALWSY